MIEERLGLAVMVNSDVVVASFYTDDDYYRGHAARLVETLDSLGLAHDVREIHKPDGADWADICRRKIAFLDEVCTAHPHARVFWIDVDCSLTALPAFVQGFSADLIGFQRGFGSPSTIGYGRRTRFWEPCFFGINATEGGRAFIRAAAELERSLAIKATDDYFFEESWRTHGPDLSFQVIPSGCAVRADTVEAVNVAPFFIFGSSGNVKEFRGKVEQHAPVAGSRPATFRSRARRFALRAAKATERILPDAVARTARRFSDTVGLTGTLVGADSTGASPQRQSVVATMLDASQRGDNEALHGAMEHLRTTGVLTTKERASIAVAQSFAHYAARPSSARDDDAADDDLRLLWWARPFPGNFGDWLSPLIVAHYAHSRVTFQPPAARANRVHLVGLGSIGRFIKPNSIVVGTGISRGDTELSRKATYLSVRGPLTAQLLVDSGGPRVTNFGDPGVLMRRVMPVERGETNGRLALVRHSTHCPLAVRLPADVDEFSVLLSHPDKIRELLTTLAAYDGVVTSAMHIMIVCQSYGIPCALVTFEGFETRVHGTGIKYEDYSLGAGLGTVYRPEPVPTDMRAVPLRSMLRYERVSDAKLDEVEEAMRTGIALTAKRSRRLTAVA